MELYVHIPFCVKKCAYCDFLSFPQGEEIQRRYVEKLMEEIRTVSAGFHDTPVSSVFVGGGTPSVLKARWMKELFDCLRASFHIEETAEISMEANPGTVDREKLRIYRDAGINRLSFGLQSADNRELKALGRIHTWEEFLESFWLAREAGFSNLNVDLMSALPGQTVESWMDTLKKTADLDPEHISAYSLIIVEGTPFFEAYGNGRGDGILPDEDAEREMYHRTREFLKDRGYERYEISNYARPGMECRHNLGYWTGVSYLGLGLGASSYTFFHRYHNTDDMEEYLSLDLSEAGAAVRDIQEISLEERMEEFMFLGLRMMEGVSGTDFFSRFGQNMWNVYGTVIERLEQQGLLEVEMPVIRLTEQGIDVSNRVLSQFLLD